MVQHLGIQKPGDRRLGQRWVQLVARPWTRQLESVAVQELQLRRKSPRFELRAESFNVWNHTEFDQVSNGLGSSNFGQVTSAFDPRVFQFGAKIYF